jgi:hypothetical protein
MNPVLYKFNTAKSAIKILESGQLWATDPLDFNDPFEILPAFDERRRKIARDSRDEFGRIDDGPDIGTISEIASRDYPGMPGLIEECHELFYRSISERYRVICFSQNAKDVLIWSHYGDSHKGIAIGFDVTVGGFPRGRHPSGMPVTYVTSREHLALPEHAYYFNALREHESKRLPDSEVLHNGLVIPKTHLDREVHSFAELILKHKNVCWRHESELRFLYDLTTENRDGLIRSVFNISCHERLEKDVSPFGDEAIKEIRVGCYCPPDCAETIFEMRRQGRFPNAKLYVTSLHADQYEIDFRGVSDLELLNCQKFFRPSSWRGRTR